MEIINSFGAIIGIMTLALTGGVVLYGRFDKERGSNLRQDNADLRASNQDKVTAIASLTATNTAQARQIKDLQLVATQTPEVKQLLAATAKQQQIINKQHADVITKLADLAEAISNMTAEFTKVVQAMGVNTKAQNANTASREQ